jgi:hypothetical protein
MGKVYGRNVKCTQKGAARIYREPFINQSADACRFDTASTVSPVLIIIVIIIATLFTGA